MSRPLRTAVLVAAIGVVCPALALAQSAARPMMDPNKPVQCYRDQENKVWRVQCSAISKLCLYAPNEELSTGGRRVKPLERAQPCPAFGKKKFNRAGLEAQGFAFIQGRPDAPHGWTRDERGRVFQVNFDLKRRGYIGGSYAPAKPKNEPIVNTRSSVDFGLLVFEHYSGNKIPNRHRVRLIEGEVFLEPFSGELVLAHYDLSRRFLEPLLRFTTFVGQPRRYDLKLNLGVWADVGRLELHHTPAANSSLWRFAMAQGTLDLWQSPRLDSYVRVRTGAGIERLYADGLGERTAVTAASALEADMVVDPKGFHNLRAELRWERPYYLTPRPIVGRRADRLQARVEYEVIVLAINDQPLSLRLDAGGEKRSDIPGIADEWAFVANAGLRFSLWAPPRPPG